MAEESPSADLAERWRQAHEAFLRGDHDAAMSLYAPGAVWDTSFLGIGSFEGRETIRRHVEDWIAPYKEFESEFEERQDGGNGVVFAVSRQKGRPAGSTGRIQLRCTRDGRRFVASSKTGGAITTSRGRRPRRFLTSATESRLP